MMPEPIGETQERKKSRKNKAPKKIVNIMTDNSTESSESVYITITFIPFKTDFIYFFLKHSNFFFSKHRFIENRINVETTVNVFFFYIFNPELRKEENKRTNKHMEHTRDIAPSLTTDRQTNKRIRRTDMTSQKTQIYSHILISQSPNSHHSYDTFQW